MGGTAMETYGVKYLDRKGQAKRKEFRTEKARETWLAKGLESGAVSEILARAEPEIWKQTPVRDLRTGDVIETPGNGASERVTFHEEIRPDWFRYGVTGNQDRNVPGGTLVLKLFR